MFHLQIRRVIRGVKDAATDRLRYIARTGRYARRGDIVRHVRSINMPDWVKSNSDADYWREADSPRVRSNGRLLFTVEFAVPRALGLPDQDQLALDFCRLVSRMSTGRHDKSNMPCTYALHEGVKDDDAATGRLPNPHVHMLLSTSVNDGIRRPSLRWFRRANRVQPEEAGAPRSQFVGTRKWLLRVRRMWARVANAALKRAGYPATLDHRSHRARGLLATPSIHVGPQGSHLAREGLPTWRTKRNARILLLNAAHDALKASALLWQQIGSHRVLEQQESESNLRKSQSCAMAELEAELAFHPLAGDHDDMLSVATAFLYTWDLSHPSTQLGSPQFAQLRSQVQRALGANWLVAQIGNRVWLLHPPSDKVIVIGRGFVATDGKTDMFLDHFARVVKALKLDALHGAIRPEIRVRMAKSFLGLDLSWPWGGVRVRKPVRASKP